jgi:hypothetical protein
MNPCTGFARMLLWCLAINYYLREPNTDDTAHLLSFNESRGFLGYLAALTARIGNGRTIFLVGKSSSKGIRRGARLY